MPGSFAVLIYHRVGEVPVDPHGLSIPTTDFANQMEIISGECEIVPLVELVLRHSRGEFLRRTLAVTFDDGYVDNLEVASPILLKFKIPATFFLTTEQLEQKRYVYWWDTLAQLLLESGSVPETVSFEHRGKLHLWELRTETDRMTAYSALCGLLTHLPTEDRRSVLRKVLDCMPALERPGSVRRMNAVDIRELSARKGHSVGAHTVSHARLPAESKQVQRTEISNCRILLEQLTGQTVNSFAYPFGDASQETVALVREAGFTAAVGCDPFDFGGITPWTVPRANPHRLTGTHFRNWLAPQVNE